MDLLVNHLVTGSNYSVTDPYKAAGTMCIDGMIRAAAMPIGSAGSNACVGASSTIPASASAATQAMTNTACDGSAPGSFKCAEDGELARCDVLTGI